MRKICTLIAALFYFSYFDLNAQGPISVWATSAGGNNQENIIDMASDPGGNVYITGYFKSTTLGPLGIYTLNNSADPGEDMFVVKFNSSGVVQWVVLGWGFGGSSYYNERGTGIEYDASSGNVIVTGNFASPGVVFGNLATQFYNADAAGGTSDVFVTGINAGSGNVVWATAFGGTLNDYSNDVVTDNSGNIYITGSFASTSFNIVTPNLTNSTAGLPTAYVAMLNSSGTPVWAKQQNSTQSGTGNCLATDGTDLYVAGNFTMPGITFGSVAATTTNNNTDAFTAKFTASNGNAAWIKTGIGSGTATTDADEIRGIIIGGGGADIYVTGYFISPGIVFGVTTLTNNGGAGTADIVTAKYNTSGTMLWAKKEGSANSEQAYKVRSNASGDVFVSGYFSSPTLVVGATTLTNAGAATSADILLMAYDNAGNSLWAKRAGGTGNDIAFAVETDGNFSGDFFLGARFESASLTMGSTTLTNPNPGPGLGDILIAKLSSSTLGLENYSADNNEIKIFPNPFTNKIAFLSTEAKQSVSVYNSLGQIVYSNSFQSEKAGNKIEIDLSNQNSGIYFVRITNENSSFIKKIIKE